MIDKIKNKKARDAFNAYLESHYNPSINLIAKEIGISHSYLVRWKNGFVDLEDKLALVEAFIIEKVN